MAADRMALQSAEFDALRKVRKAFDDLCQVPIVDDDYPEYRHRYKCAMRDLLDAVAKNRVDPETTWAGVCHYYQAGRGK